MLLDKPYDTSGVTSTASEIFIPSVPDLPWYPIGRTWPPFDTHLASTLIVAVNAHRKSIGVPALKNSVPLRKSARWKSCHMAEFQYEDHNDPPAGSPPIPPTPRNFGQRVYAAGWPYTKAAGENIGYGYTDANSILTAWLSDDGHRNNIENELWASLGIGVAASRPTQNTGVLLFWTLDVGS